MHGRGAFAGLIEHTMAEHARATMALARPSSWGWPLKLPSPLAMIPPFLELPRLASVPPQEGLSRSRFLVVGCADSNVRILGLDPEDGLRNLALQAVPSMPFSALFLFRCVCPT